MSFIGIRWLTTATSPVVARNAVIASATGSSAATSAPKAISRMPSATGTAEYSARLKSLPKASSKIFWELASPNSSTRRSLCCSCTPRTAARTGSTRSDAVSGSPSMSNLTRADLPSAEIVSMSYGDWTLVTLPVSFTAVITPPTTVRNAGSVAFTVPPVDWTSTISPAGPSFSPASSRIFTACPYSPGTSWLSVVSTRPATDPMASARTTNSSHPPTASQRCRALQPPIAAAMPAFPCVRATSSPSYIPARTGSCPAAVSYRRLTHSTLWPSARATNPAAR